MLSSENGLVICTVRTASYDRKRYFDLSRQPVLILKPSGIPRPIRIAMSFNGHCRDPLRAEALNQWVIVRGSLG